MTGRSGLEVECGLSGWKRCCDITPEIWKQFDGIICKHNKTVAKNDVVPYWKNQNYWIPLFSSQNFHSQWKRGNFSGSGAKQKNVSFFAVWLFSPLVCCNFLITDSSADSRTKGPERIQWKGIFVTCSKT